jgi:hypothetical protein
MSDTTASTTIEMPVEGPLVLEFVLYYKDGSYDHSRTGRKFRAVRTAGGTEHGEYSLRKGNIPGVSFVSESFRTSSRHQETKSALTIERDASLPIVVLFDEIDEYHPDYYNQQGLDWEERQATINNKDLEYLVVPTGALEGKVPC